MKELDRVDNAIIQTRKLFNDLNIIRDRNKALKMQETTMSILSSLMDLKDDLSRFEDKLSKLEKIEAILLK
ncbi:hypothetical protein [Francisella uliginis]|uniref:Uncharacterized protein n=1 Tax=Francisella uliginis TaxID=573570 RepID=A0A1L4BRZ6_9GAMM|nr:hypothetical protein [Francisella uliginis]API86616.1 hypothetical protein F7310_04240 [Francisella uliginis]